MKFKDALLRCEENLRKVSGEPHTETQILLGHILNCKPSEIVGLANDELTKIQLEELEKLVTMRLTSKPIQYVLNEAWFWKYPFYVDERVLIPRPETEGLIEIVLGVLSGQQKFPNMAEYIPNNLQLDKKLEIADIGTGCGAIAISLAKEIANMKINMPTTIYATDVSKYSLQVAELNMETLISNTKTPLTNKPTIKFVQGSLLDPLNDMPDILLANLPYIPNGRLKLLQPEVKNFEPQIALDGGADGFDWYRKLFRQLAKRERFPKLLLFEMDYSHADLLDEEIKKSGLKTKAVASIHDLERKMRYGMIWFK